MKKSKNYHSFKYPLVKLYIFIFKKFKKTEVALVNLTLLFVRNFIPTRPIIIFSSYGGTKFNDSPYYLYNKIKLDYRFKNFKLYWAFKNEKMFQKGLLNLKIGSVSFYAKCLQSKYIITNATFMKNINFKGRGTIYLNTWHGSALKRIGNDRDSGNDGLLINGKNIVDFMTAQSEFDIKVFNRALGVPIEKIKKTGLPRNEYLIQNNGNHNLNRTIKDKLKINNNKKVILFAPTYRNYNKEKHQGHYVELSLETLNMLQELSSKFNILYRSHYYIKINKNPLMNFVIDVSNYMHVEHLLLISDILITDYSSLMFDYTLLKKPIYIYAPDYDKYKELVGFYNYTEELVKPFVYHKPNKLVRKLLNESIEKNTLDRLLVNKNIINSGEDASSKILNLLIKAS